MELLKDTDLLKDILKKHNFSDREIEILYDIVKEIAMTLIDKRRINMYIKRNVIAQIQKDYGYNYKQAEDFYNKIDDECRAEFDAEYYAEAKKSFWED